MGVQLGGAVAGFAIRVSLAQDRVAGEGIVAVVARLRANFLTTTGYGLGAVAVALFEWGPLAHASKQCDREQRRRSEPGALSATGAGPLRRLAFVHSVFRKLPSIDEPEEAYVVRADSARPEPRSKAEYARAPGPP